MKYNPGNIIESLHEIGPWSSYYLAEIALTHWFPDEFSEDKPWEASRMVELADSIGCDYWEDVIKKFQTEVGYKDDDFKPDYVNEH